MYLAEHSISSHSHVIPLKGNCVSWDFIYSGFSERGKLYSSPSKGSFQEVVLGVLVLKKLNWVGPVDNQDSTD